MTFYGQSAYARKKQAAIQRRRTIWAWIIFIGLFAAFLAFPRGVDEAQNEIQANLTFPATPPDSAGVEPEPKPCNGRTAHKVGWDDNTLQQRAYEISDCDEKFVLTLDCENGEWTTDRLHEWSAQVNKHSLDWGLCGINDFWHGDVVNDPNFHDFEFQLGKCLEFYRTGQLACADSPAKLATAAESIFFLDAE